MERHARRVPRVHRHRSRDAATLLLELDRRRAGRSTSPMPTSMRASRSSPPCTRCATTPMRRRSRSRPRPASAAPRSRARSRRGSRGCAATGDASSVDFIARDFTPAFDGVAARRRARRLSLDFAADIPHQWQSLVPSDFGYPQRPAPAGRLARVRGLRVFRLGRSGETDGRHPAASRQAARRRRSAGASAPPPRGSTGGSAVRRRGSRPICRCSACAGC